MPPFTTIRLKENPQSIANRFKQEIIKVKLNKMLSRATSNIEKGFKSLIEQAIKDSPEYMSLLGVGRPSLKEHFGLPNAEARINNVISTWVSNTFLQVKPFTIMGNKIRGGINLGIVRVDLSEVLGISASTLSVTINTGKQKGQPFDIDWLKWLMHEGDREIVLEHHIDIGRGRAGDFTMHKGGTWGVPLAFRGFKGNNFVTRSAKPLEKEFAKVVKMEFSKAI